MTRIPGKKPPPSRKNLGGRPRKSPDVVAAGLALVATGASPEEAAEKLRELGRPVAARTLRNALAAPPTLAARPSAAASSVPAHDGPSLDLVRGILAARHPAALAELDTGLALWKAGGDLEAWKSRPLPVAEIGEDMLGELRQMLAMVRGRAAIATDTRFASLMEKANALIGRIEEIERRRPKPKPPDAVLEELRRLEADAIEQIEVRLPNPITAKELQ